MEKTLTQRSSIVFIFAIFGALFTAIAAAPIGFVLELAFPGSKDLPASTWVGGVVFGSILLGLASVIPLALVGVWLSRKDRSTYAGTALAAAISWVVFWMVFFLLFAKRNPGAPIEPIEFAALFLVVAPPIISAVACRRLLVWAEWIKP